MVVEACVDVLAVSIWEGISELVLFEEVVEALTVGEEMWWFECA